MVYTALADRSDCSNSSGCPEFTAHGYSLYAGGTLLLFGPPDAVSRIAANLNAEPPDAGGLPVRVMAEIQQAGGGVYLPREGLRGQW
jgi:hypothetical protein